MYCLSKSECSHHKPHCWVLRLMSRDDTLDYLPDSGIGGESLGERIELKESFG